jgi:hypothetical protein
VIPCPSCGSTEVRVSKTSRWSDVFHLIVGREAFRCRNCRQRFFARQAEDPAVSPSSRQGSNQRSRPRMSTTAKRRLQQRLLIIFIFALALTIFGFFLRYILREPSPPSDSGLFNTPMVALDIRTC